LPCTNQGGGRVVAWFIRDRLEELHLPHAGSSVADQVTLSIGVACRVPERGISSDTLIAAADQALYQAKARGRNRVVIEGESAA
jgi:diguanylate cyclase (GGDEF)-like protein